MFEQTIPNSEKYLTDLFAPVWVFLTSVGQINLVKQIQCPICGSDDKFKVFDITYSQGLSTVLWSCATCDYHYVFPVPSQDFLTSFYNNDYCSHVATLNNWRQQAMVERVRRIEKFKSPPARLLDIGCGNGNFCFVAHSLGWDVHGIEPSKPAVERADPSIRQKLRIGTLTTTGFPEGSFDVITYWAVLEHLLDPITDIERAVRLLQPNGILFLQLPNIRSFAARAYGENWRLIKNSPDHVGFVTNNTIRYFCDRFHLSLLQRRFYGLPFPLGKLPPQDSVPVSYSIVNSREQSVLSNVLGRPVLARMIRATISLLRLGDNVEYVLRKQ